MSITVQDLIQSSLRLIKASSHGRIAAAPLLSDALASLNQMIDAWGTERLTMYTTSRTVFNVVSGQQVYTMGPTGADWTAPRPQYIDEAGLLLSGTPTTEIPLTILETERDWAEIRVKATTSPIPTKLYYESDFPNGQIALWPVPSAASQIALYTPVAVSQFTSLAQTISLPPGYQKALAYGLAVELAPECGANLDPLVFAQAERALASIKRQNFSVKSLRCDPALVGIGGRGRFDITLGESR
jgi:hypothetical protein